jgi:uncharacterized RDD family membrane protein YckC
MEMPVELMSPDDRKERIAELKKRLSRGWMQAMVLETAGIFVPFVLVFLLYLNGSISQAVFILIATVLGGLMAAFWIGFILNKAQPLQREIEALELLEGAPVE